MENNIFIQLFNSLTDEDNEGTPGNCEIVEVRETCIILFSELKCGLMTLMSMCTSVCLVMFAAIVFN